MPRLHHSKRYRRRGGTRKFSHWSSAETTFLIDNYKTMKARDIGARLGRTRNAVVGRASKLGVHKISRREWTKREVSYLRSTFSLRGGVSVARALKRTTPSVDGKAKKLGLRYAGEQPWTPRQAAVLGIRIAPGHKWAKRELNQLRLQAGRRLPRGAAPSAVRTHAAVQRLALKLGIMRPRGRRWTAREDAYIRKHGERRFAEDIGKDLKRTTNAVRMRGRELGVKMIKRLIYTPRQSRFILANYKRMTYGEIGEALGITRKVVEKFLYQRGLRQRGARHIWTRDDVRLLRRLYKKVPAVEIARRIGSTYHGVMCVVAKLGIGNHVGRWSKRELTILRKGWGRVPTHALAERLNRRPETVRAQAKAVGLPFLSSVQFSKSR